MRGVRRWVHRAVAAAYLLIDTRAFTAHSPQHNQLPPERGSSSRIQPPPPPDWNAQPVLAARPPPLGFATGAPRSAAPNNPPENIIES
ncbi:hypothetical protein Q1695_008906 [Nippostrongylus brasiliensis]|nr:hypothetical protein Q1695_008906 [Nippostrongylus brasiliensis]